MALRFYGNSSNSYYIPTEAAYTPYSTTISLVFQTENLRSGVMLAIEKNQTNHGVALRVNGGAVEFEYQDGSNFNILNVSSIREEQWYQLYASV